MWTRHVTLKAESGSAEIIPPITESQSLPLIPVQKESPDEIIFSPEYTRQNRNSKLVGFERGSKRLQPFVGPKEF
jgi:hypothetical protein